jgi:hypothetical protein
MKDLTRRAVGLSGSEPIGWNMYFYNEISFDLLANASLFIAASEMGRPSHRRCGRLLVRSRGASERPGS